MPTLETTGESYELPAIDPIVRGDSRRLRFAVTVDGTPKDITGDTLRWGLFDRAYQSDFATAALSDDDDLVAIRTDPTTDPTAGEFEVTIDEGGFDIPPGEYHQRVVVAPANSSRQTWIGRVIVQQ